MKTPFQSLRRLRIRSRGGVDPTMPGAMAIAVAASFTLAIATPTEAKTIDLSTRTDPTGTYNVAFCARPSPDSSGKPGHAFVSYSHKLPNGERDFVAIGHTIT